jgi:uncharacterized protein YcfJ
MKRILIASLFASTLLGAQAEVFTDNARVLSAEPMLENINVPRNECSSRWVEGRYPRADANIGQQDHQIGGAILGGVAGGVIGHQMGAGSGKDAATVVGVMLGAIAGDRLANRDQARVYPDPDRYGDRGPREVQVCRTVYDSESRVTGYRVAYEYRGQQYTTVTRNHPGHQLRVRVSVDPVEH